MRTVDFTVFCFSKLKPHIESQGYTSLLVFHLCVCVFCLHAHMCTTCVLGACRSQKRSSDHLELELGFVSSMRVLRMEPERLYS